MPFLHGKKQGLTFFVDYDSMCISNDLPWIIRRVSAQRFNLFTIKPSLHYEWSNQTLDRQGLWIHRPRRTRQGRVFSLVRARWSYLR